jgi:hypothetical protein
MRRLLQTMVFLTLYCADSASSSEPVMRLPGVAVPEMVIASKDRGNVRIISRSNDLVIHKALANRGNCEVTDAYTLDGKVDQYDFPFALRFGERLNIDTDCNLIIEVRLETNLGPLTVSWDK